MGVNQAELARRTKCSPSAIGTYIRAEKTPDPQTVFAIENALDLAPGTFSHVFGYGPPNGSRPPGTIEALMADPKLKDVHKRALLGIYQALVASTEG